MKINKINGMKVITLDAYTLGEVAGGHFNPETWEITNLDLKLSKEANEKLGYIKPKIEIGLKKPKLSTSIILCLPVSYVKSMGSVITLTENLEAFKDLKVCQEE